MVSFAELLIFEHVGSEEQPIEPGPSTSRGCATSSKKRKKRRRVYRDASSDEEDEDSSSSEWCDDDESDGLPVLRRKVNPLKKEDV